MNFKRYIRFAALVVALLVCIQALVSCDVSSILGNEPSQSDGTTEAQRDETNKVPDTTQDNESSNRPPEEQDDSTGLAFELHYDGASYAVSGIGSCTDKNIVIPSSYEGYPVVMINDYAFYGCDIESVIIPDTVITIGNSAFENCSALSSVTIGERVASIGRGAFLACTQLKNIVIPDRVTSIGMSAFEACGKLESVSFGSRVVEIGDYAFSLCGSLSNVTVPDNVASLGIGAFNSCMGLESVTLGGGINVIRERTFSECYDLEKITFYSSVRIIESHAFNMCESLDSVDFYGSQADWDSISISAGNGQMTSAEIFYKVVEPELPQLEFELNSSRDGYVVVGIGSLKESDLIIPNVHEGLPVTEIGSEAFERCENLRSVVIPDSVTKIGAGAFANNSNLMHVTFGEGLVEIEDSAFMSTRLLQVVLPDSVRTIDDNAFADCVLLESIDLGEGVVSIGNFAFAYCIYINEIILPDSVEAVGVSAFEGCENLKTVGLHPDIVYMEDPFDNCDELETVIFRGNQAEWTVLCFILDLDCFEECTVKFADGSQIGGEETQPGGEETQPGGEETQPGGEETKPGGEETQPGGEETQPGGEETQPGGEETHPGGEETQPGGDPDENEYSQGLEYMPSDDGDGYYVIGLGSCTDTRVVIPSTYNGKSVTGIAANAFAFSDTVIEVVIPDGVTYIGASAFSGCMSLVSIYLPDSIVYIESGAFRNCLLLKEITIGENVSYIGNSAFFGCNALEKINYNAVYVRDLDVNNDVFAYAGKNGEGIALVVGNKVSKIPAALFGQKYRSSSYAPNLISVTFEEESTCKLIGKYAFYGCSRIGEINIPDSVKIIGESAFYNCEGIKILTVGRGVQKLGASAFGNLYSLETLYFNAERMYDLSEKAPSFAYAGYQSGGARVIVGACVTRIPACVFYNKGYTSYAKSLEFEDGSVCTEIGSYAFAIASNMTEIEIGEAVTYIAPDAFASCKAVNKIYFNAANLVNETLNGCFSNNLGSESGSIEIVFGSLVEKIPAYLCYGIGEQVDKITFAKDSACQSIGEYAFYNTSISSLELPNGLVRIGGYAFDGCDSITELVIPASVKTIEEYAFSDCRSLTDVTVYEGIEGIGFGIFSGCALQYTEYFGAYYLGSSNNPYAYLFSAASTSISDCEIHKDTKAIFPEAFKGCNSLREITIPDGVISVGAYAFEKCYSLTTVTLGKGIKAIPNGMFSECEYLTEMNIPEGITSIGDSAFAYCEDLGEITIPNSVTEIGDSAFYYCESLISVTIPGSVKKISNNAFWNCRFLSSVTLGEGVKEIGYRAFANCQYLSSIALPDSIEYIDATAFYQSSYYASLEYNEYEGMYYFGNEENPYAVLVGPSENVAYSPVIHKDTKMIMSKAFRGCTMTEIVIPDSVVYIGDQAFEECTSLERVVIGNGVKAIGNSAFYCCENLSDITFGNGLESIGDFSFSGCHALEELTLPEGLTSIGEQAVASCGALRKVVIPSSVRSMGYMAFGACRMLEDVTIEQGVEIIGEYAFYGCEALANIVIPDSVTEIGGNAFGNCASLDTLTLGNGIKSIGTNAFYNTAIEKVYAPSAEAWLNITFADAKANPISSAEEFYVDGKLLTELVIPKGIEYVSAYAFYGYDRLNSVVFSDSVVSVGNSAFNKTVKNVYFTGYAEEWGFITIGSGNKGITNATVYCEYGK